jgi:hypothetical protein
MDSPLHFGNLHYIPEPPRVLPVTGSIKEVMPRFRHALSPDQEAAMLADVNDTRPIKRFYPVAANVYKLDEWIDDPENMPKELIDVCRNAITAEFGHGGSSGYYKRIMAKVLQQVKDSME